LRNPLCFYYNGIFSGFKFGGAQVAKIFKVLEKNTAFKRRGEIELSPPYSPYRHIPMPDNGNIGLYQTNITE